MVGDLHFQSTRIGAGAAGLDDLADLDRIPRAFLHPPRREQKSRLSLGSVRSTVKVSRPPTVGVRQ